MTDQALNPVQVEHKLRAVEVELYKALDMLRAARDREVDAEIKLMRARDDAAESAPRVRRGEVTVAEREEFVDRMTRREREVVLRAATERKNGEDYLRVTRDHASVVQSMARQVDTAYRIVGAS